jgi:hypothetical protein
MKAPVGHAMNADIRRRENGHAIKHGSNLSVAALSELNSSESDSHKVLHTRKNLAPKAPARHPRMAATRGSCMQSDSAFVPASNGEIAHLWQH